MIEYVINTGDTGRMRIQDRTDEEEKIVELWVQSLSPILVSQLPWAYSVNLEHFGWRSFRFESTTVWQRVGRVIPGNNQQFTFHLGNTGTSQLNGPTDQTINLAGYDPFTEERSVSIKVGTKWVTAIPYVKADGVWQPAIPYVRVERGWQEIR